MSRKMTVTQLTILTAVNMIGSGIILLPAKLAQVGTISITSWLITAGGSLALAYVFAQCALFSRKAGGMGGYAEYAFGRGGNYMANYTYGLSLVIANVAISITAVGYATELFGAKLSPLGVGLATIGLLWLTTIANFGGARITGRIGSVSIWGVIGPVLAVATIGWFWFSGSTWLAAWNPHNTPIFEAMGGSISITLWAFLGLESACANSDAVENPERNVPIAVLGGTIGAAVIYIISTNVIAGIVPNAELAASTAPFGLTFARMFNPLVGNIVTGLMVFACIGSLLGWQFTVAQVFKSSADAGYFSNVFRKTTSAGVPIASMLILLALQTLLALSTISPELAEQFNTLVNVAVVTNIVPYVMSMAAIITIQKFADVEPHKARVTNILALVASLYSYYALYSAGQVPMVIACFVIFMGWTLWGVANLRFLKMEHDKDVRSRAEVRAQQGGTDAGG
ncbi:Putrescine transporter PotE [Andreprevotia sp. IGB-42]|uniref:putrescine-ornithine antiporter n=1 Tax=Andreprevotia sp. IGB-42 TaxID=2497473 RepID=UPI0013578BF6|nr:putrescine-ornithine antiporter [Andreprevotia sp. IGB-42]KAF0813609.1 Putrescine transporter PotE [Andreprevotia sp. IGB-42]